MSSSFSPNRGCRIVVGICSCHGYGEKRQAVRETWMASQVEGIKSWFFIGGDAPNASEPDTVGVPADDSYDYLPQKVLAFFRHALENFEFEWLFKCDDDTYVALDRLSSLIEPGYDLIGSRCISKRGAPSGGSGYFLSRTMIEKLLSDGSLPSVGPEDLIIGLAVTRLGGKSLPDDRLGLYQRPCPRPDNDRVTAHWCSPQHLRAIHFMMNNDPVGETMVVHSRWSDMVKVYDQGWFVREASGCCGRWTIDEEGILHLNWLDWPAERFASDNIKNVAGSIAWRYTQVATVVGGTVI